MDEETLRRVAENTILLGDDASNFFKQDIGQYIMERSRQQVSDGFMDLLDTDPFDGNKISAIKLKILTAMAVPEWLQEAIISGEQELEKQLYEEGG